MPSFIQQNKNKINRISTSINKIMPTLYAYHNFSRECSIFIENTNLATPLLSIKYSTVVDKVKVIESRGKVFWCTTVKSIKPIELKVRHSQLARIDITGNPNGSELQELVYKFIDDQLSTKVRTYWKPLRDADLHPYIPNIEDYSDGINITKDRGIIENSPLYKNLLSSFKSLFFQSNFIVGRNEDVLKTLGDSALLPVLWYGITDEKYSLQGSTNYDSDPSTSGRSYLGYEVVESDLNRFIRNSIVHFPIQNWAHLEIKNSLIEKQNGNVS